MSAILNIRSSSNGLNDFTKYIDIEIIMNNSKQTDLMGMDVTWSLEDLELYDHRIGVGEATIFTISKTIVLAMGMMAQKTFYKMMERLPGRVINQILYLHMVRATYNTIKDHWLVWFLEIMYFLKSFSNLTFLAKFIH